MMCERPPVRAVSERDLFSRGAATPPHEEGNLPLLRLYVQSLQEGNTRSWQFIHIAFNSTTIPFGSRKRNSCSSLEGAGSAPSSRSLPVACRRSKPATLKQK